MLVYIPKTYIPLKEENNDNDAYLEVSLTCEIEVGKPNNTKGNKKDTEI